MSDFRVEKASSTDAVGFNYESDAENFALNAGKGTSFVPMVDETAMESPADMELGLMNASPEAIEMANEEAIGPIFWVVVGGCIIALFTKCSKEEMPEGVIAESHSSLHGDIPITNDTTVIHTTDTTIVHTTDTVHVTDSIQVPVNPPITVDDSLADAINEVLCDPTNEFWEGADNITGRIVITDYALNQNMEIVLSTKPAENFVETNSLIAGRVYDVNNDPVAPGNFTGELMRLQLAPGMIDGCNAPFGVVIKNPLDGRYSLYVPNNDKTAIYVFDMALGKGFKKVSIVPAKVDPTPENGYAPAGRGLPDGVPENCNVVIKREQYDDEDGNVRIYARSATNGQFFVKSGNFIMQNK